MKIYITVLLITDGIKADQILSSYFKYRGVTIDGREVGGKSSSSYELSSFARHGAADPQVGTTLLYFFVY